MPVPPQFPDVWLLRKSLINKLLTLTLLHLLCLHLHENALTGDEIRHLWHRSTLVELLATRTCSVKNTTITIVNLQNCP